MNLNLTILKYCIVIFIFLSSTVDSSYTLHNRKYHTASYINDKIYFLGGQTDDEPLTNDFFYLDVSKPFNINSDIPIVYLPYNVTNIPKHARATSVICGPKNDIIFTFGGEIEKNNDVLKPLVFSFDITNSEWFNVNAKGIEPIRRNWPVNVCDKNAKMNVFGGSTVIANQTVFKNDFNILNTMINPMTWEIGTDVDIPPPMDASTATLLPNGKIVFLGGNTAHPPHHVEMSKIYLYDTNESSWTTMNTIGNPPAARGLHTSVLTTDGRIIVYGGENPQYQPAPDQLSVLDTMVQPFKWIITSTNSTPATLPFKGHTATLVGNYMIVAFGMLSSNISSNQIHILDISDRNNYRWVLDFTPSTSLPVSTSTSLTSILVPVSIAIFAVIFVIIIITVCIFCRKRRYNNNYINGSVVTGHGRFLPIQLSSRSG